MSSDKRFWTVVGIILVYAGVVISFKAFAQTAPSPFLVCTSVAPSTTNTALNPVSYQITGLGTAVITTPATTNADGSIQLNYSLAGVANGNYTVTVSATNSQGFVGPASSPFTFTLPVSTPAAPAGLSLSSK